MIDVTIGEDFDLSLENGDFLLSESTEQSLQMLTLANKGEWRETPQAGVGIVNYLNSQDTTEQTLRREIQVQLDLDNFNPTGISIDLPTIDIKGNYANA